NLVVFSSAPASRDPQCSATVDDDCDGVETTNPRETLQAFTKQWDMTSSGVGFDFVLLDVAAQSKAATRPLDQPAKVVLTLLEFVVEDAETDPIVVFRPHRSPASPPEDVALFTLLEGSPHCTDGN